MAVKPDLPEDKNGSKSAHLNEPRQELIKSFRHRRGLFFDGRLRLSFAVQAQRSVVQIIDIPVAQFSQLPARGEV